MKRQLSLLAFFVAVIFLVSGCGSANGNSGGGGGKVAVVISPAVVRLDEGTVENDPSSPGVTWNITGDGTLSNVTDTSATVTAGNITGSFVLSASAIGDSAADSVAKPGFLF